MTSASPTDWSQPRDSQSVANLDLTTTPAASLNPDATRGHVTFRTLIIDDRRRWRRRRGKRSRSGCASQRAERQPANHTRSWRRAIATRAAAPGGCSRGHRHQGAARPEHRHNRQNSSPGRSRQPCLRQPCRRRPALLLHLHHPETPYPAPSLGFARFSTRILEIPWRCKRHLFRGSIPVPPDNTFSSSRQSWGGSHADSRFSWGSRSSRARRPRQQAHRAVAHIPVNLACRRRQQPWPGPTGPAET